MTYAQNLGIVAGKRFTVVGPRAGRTDINASHGVKIGSVVVLNRDDTTDTPYFDLLDTDNKVVSYSVLIDLSATELKEIQSTGILFEDKEVTTQVTVINAGRQLTEAQKSAIQAIILQGA